MHQICHEIVQVLGANFSTFCVGADYFVNEGFINNGFVAQNRDNIIKYSINHHHSCNMQTHVTMYCKYYQLQVLYTLFSPILSQVYNNVSIYEMYGTCTFILHIIQLYNVPVCVYCGPSGV